VIASDVAITKVKSVSVIILL